MRSLRDRESMQRGSPDYPLDYYLIDRNHPRYEMPYHWHAETELLHVGTRFTSRLDACMAASRRTASMNALFLTCIS